MISECLFNVSILTIPYSGVFVSYNIILVRLL